MRLDHVCVVVDDVDRSIHFYSNILGLRHSYADEPTFGKDPAFLESPTIIDTDNDSAHGLVRVALLPSLVNSHIGRTKRKHHGSHFAVSVPRESFERFRERLPLLLEQERIKWEKRTSRES